MGKQALRESAERIRNVPKVLKDTANTVKNTAQEGLTATKNMATNFGDNVRNLNFGQPRLVADGFGDVGPSFIRNTNEAASNAGRVVRESASHLDDVPKIKEVPYGEHIIKGKGGRKELAPNTRYVTEDGYKYTTDELGRVVDVDADSLILKTAERNEGMQRIAGREYRLADDDGGHLIGSQFNGPGDIDNLVAQNSQINRSGGEWYRMEQEWASALKETPPRKVTVKINPFYSGESLRPDAFKISYSIEGQGDFVKFIENIAGG
ncbi:DNA/RNA non-specific endonuclease [Listeria booriae]|nr:DNA/RNA non-specific endonuclease [Listeria booriae]